MLLPVNDQYRLVADSHGCMIEEKCVCACRREQRQKWTPILWYPTLAEAVEGYAQLRVALAKHGVRRKRRDSMQQHCAVLACPSLRNR